MLVGDVVYLVRSLDILKFPTLVTLCAGISLFFIFNPFNALPKYWFGIEAVVGYVAGFVGEVQWQNNWQFNVL